MPCRTFLLLLLGAVLCVGDSLGSSSVASVRFSSVSSSPSLSSFSGSVVSSSWPPWLLSPAPMLSFHLAYSLSTLSIRLVNLAISACDCLFSSASSATTLSRFACLCPCACSFCPTRPSWPCCALPPGTSPIGDIEQAWRVDYIHRR